MGGVFDTYTQSFSRLLLPHGIVSSLDLIQHVEQLNVYIMQLPCRDYSSSFKPGMTPENVPFAKADLASHVLRMCSHAWQDQFNLHKTGMTPVGMRLLLMSLKAIEHVYMQEKSNTHPGKKTSGKSETGNKRPGTGSTTRVPKKVCFEKHCNLCKKHGGMHTTLNTKKCCKYEKDGLVKGGFCTTKKSRKKPTPAKQSFSQLSKKSDKLEKALKKLSTPRNAVGMMAINSK